METSVEPRLAARIAWHFFKEGLTQAEIADMVGLSRARINQVIGELRSSGAIHISINTAYGPCVELEQALVEHYSLGAAIVVPSPGPKTDVRQVTGLAAGAHLDQLLRDGDVVGLGWGGTLDAAAHAIRRKTGRKNTVVSFCGGFPRSTPVNPYDVAARFARLLDGRCYYVTAPMFADSPEMRDYLLASKSVSETLRQVEKVTHALLSAVDLSPKSRSLQYGLISEDTRKSLLDAGAVGDLCGHYLTADGERAAHPLNDRVVGPDLSAITDIPNVVLASGGREKVGIIKAILRRGIASTLIIDERAATTLLQDPESKE